MKMIKACCFADKETQLIIRESLYMYVARVDMEMNVRPYQLNYRDFDCYFFCTDHMPLGERELIFERLPNVARSRRSSLFFIWTTQTMNSLLSVSPQVVGMQNVINVDVTDWPQLISNEIKRIERKKKDE